MVVDDFHHEFVEFIPSELEQGVLYISIPYATAVHLCWSGCGEKVVTPLTPTDWRLTYDGETVSLDPSIGNWSFACQSHYVIERNRVFPAPRWSRERIDAGRRRDRVAKERQFAVSPDPEQELKPERSAAPHGGLLQRLWRRLRA